MTCLLQAVITAVVVGVVRTGWRKGGEVSFDLGDTVLKGQKALSKKALQHRADTRPVHQLQHKEVGAATS